MASQTNATKAKGKAGASKKRAASRTASAAKPTDGGIKKAVGKLRDALPVEPKAVTSLPVKSTASRLAAAGPKSLVTAAAAVGAAGFGIYRLLRSGD